MEAITFIKENWYWLFPTFISVASVVVKITPTETDNKILHGIVKVCEVIAMNNKPMELKK